MALAEDFLKYIFKTLLDERQDDMEFFAKRVDKGCIERLEQLITQLFAQIDYTDAIKVLEAAPVKFEFPVRWGMDLQAEHERYLAETHIGRPVAVMNYPKDIKAFYMRLNDDNQTVAAMDVLAPGLGEIIGGSQREERLDVLDARMAEMKIEADGHGGTATYGAMGPYHTLGSARLRTSHSIRNGCRQHSRCHPVSAHGAKCRFLGMMDRHKRSLTRIVQIEPISRHPSMGADQVFFERPRMTTLGRFVALGCPHPDELATG